MKGLSFILVGLVSVAMASEVRADLRNSPSPRSNVAFEQLAQPTAGDLLNDPTCDSIGFANLDPGSGAGGAVAGLSSHQSVVRLPDAPSSTALFLSAMVSFGAWHLVRSGRDVHFGAMPEWYHTGGPFQVGHVTAFDLDFSSLPLCLFDRPIQQRRVTFRCQRDLPSRWGPQSRVLPADPRGPPVAAI